MEMHATSQDHWADANGTDFDPNNHEVEQPPSPSLVSQQQFNITQKKMVKCNLEVPAFRMTRQAQKFPPAKIGDTIKVCIPDIDCGRCNSQN